MATLDELKDAIYDWLDAVSPANTPIDYEDGDDADRTISRFTLRLLQDEAPPIAIRENDPETQDETGHPNL